MNTNTWPRLPIVERKKQYLVQTGWARYLELNRARTQRNGRNEYDTTGSVQFATVFETLALAAEAAAQWQQNYPDWLVSVVEDWR